MPLDHEDQGLRLKSEQPVMYDNLLAASAARRLSNTYLTKTCDHVVGTPYYIDVSGLHIRSGIVSTV
jgi:hypothetical protein